MSVAVWVSWCKQSNDKTLQCFVVYELKPDFVTVVILKVNHCFIFELMSSLDLVVMSLYSPKWLLSWKSCIKSVVHRQGGAGNLKGAWRVGTVTVECFSPVDGLKWLSIGNVKQTMIQPQVFQIPQMDKRVSLTWLLSQRTTSKNKNKRATNFSRSKRATCLKQTLFKL